MRYKKAQQAYEGFSTITWWVFIIAVGIVLLVILVITTEFGQETFDKISDAIPFI